MAPRSGGSTHRRQINAVALVSDGSQIAAGGADNLIRVWDFAVDHDPTSGRHSAGRNACRS